MIYQLKKHMESMKAYGESKHADKLVNNGKPAKNKIYSYQTYRNYLQSGCSFLNFVRQSHPGIKILEDARQYVPEYLTMRINLGLSAWTVRADAAALAKIYECSANDFGIRLPSRIRADISKNRTNSWKGHFAPEKHKDEVDFCKGTGLRRCELLRVTPQQLVLQENGPWLMNVKGKGGRLRDVPVDSAYASRVVEITNAARDAGSERIFESVTKYLPAHEIRAEYAQRYYDRIARDTSQLDRDCRFRMQNGKERSEVYEARRDRAGKIYDARALEEVSHALGHGRIDVMMSYLK